MQVIEKTLTELIPYEKNPRRNDKAVELTVEQVERQIESDEKLNKEVEEMFSTDDINERINIWKKHHPNEEFNF